MRRAFMAGMYPDEQTAEVFGQEISWPGLDPGTGKFTNGDFSDPLKKPSFIPAESINLILDNLANMIAKLGGTPDNASLVQLAGLFTETPDANRAVTRDGDGRAKVAAPADEDDIARKAEITAHDNRTSPHGATAEAAADRLMLRDAGGYSDAATPEAGDSSTKLATTAFVRNLKYASNPVMNGGVTPGNTGCFSDGGHRHPIDTSRAPLASPVFSGTPKIGSNPVAAISLSEDRRQRILIYRSAAIYPHLHILIMVKT
jgi:hypothetical protein